MKTQIEFPKYILFTGAGFTKNFGGFLADEMWEQIFNNCKIQKSDRLKALLLNDYDYESLYDNVIYDSSFCDNDKKVFEDAIFEAYLNLEQVNASWRYDRGPYAVDIYKLNQFIDKFHDNRRMGLFFTLNQDLFIERFYDSRTTWLTPFVSHGLTERIRQNYQQFTFSDRIQLPDNNSIDSATSINSPSNRYLHYIKMHGSLAWKSSDGKNRMVIGLNKEEQIQQEPLLVFYYDLFKKALANENVKMFIIGYGFGDRHINKIIADSVSENNLKIFILIPKGIREFHENLLYNAKEYGDTIYKGVSGYFNNKLQDIFPPDQSESEAYKNIIQKFFSAC